jgi:hypothetical protein
MGHVYITFRHIAQIALPSNLGDGGSPKTFSGGNSGLMICRMMDGGLHGFRRIPERMLERCIR